MAPPASDRDLHDIIPRWAFGAAGVVLLGAGVVCLNTAGLGELGIPVLGLGILSSWEFVWGGAGDKRPRYWPLVGSAIGAALAAASMFVIAEFTRPTVASEARSMGLLLAGLSGLLAVWTWRSWHKHQGGQETALFTRPTPDKHARQRRIALVLLAWISGAGSVVLISVALVSPRPLPLMLPALPFFVTAIVCICKLRRSDPPDTRPW